MKEIKKQTKGITLIALVITIIVLLILAGVSISMLTGENGILVQAQKAKEETEKEQKEEENILNSYEDKMNEYIGIDWDAVLANAEKHPDQVTSTAIGVGTNGKPVNMDLWEYTKLDDGTYALNDKDTITAIKEENWSEVNIGYNGKITEGGEIEGKIPQYIKSESDNTFVKVTNLDCTFYKSAELKIIPHIPDTINSMIDTFLGCTSLTTVTQLPNSIKNMQATFMRCTSLTTISNIPSNVTNMNETFYNCSNLTSIPAFPNNIETMEWTFQDCIKLTSVGKLPDSIINMRGTFRGCRGLTTITNIPNNVINMCETFTDCSSLATIPTTIPSSVNNMVKTFEGCAKLQGSIKINANLQGILIDVGSQTYIDYMDIFKNACKDVTLKVTGTCPVLQDIVLSTNNPNIILE